MKHWILVAALRTCCLSGLAGDSLSHSPPAASVAQAAASTVKMQTTRADFQKYCKAMEGRWIGEVVWVADWPGFGKKGEKVTGFDLLVAFKRNSQDKRAAG